MGTDSVGAQGGAICPPRPGTIREALMTDVLDYQGQRVQLGPTGEGKQVLRTLAYFRNQLSLVEFKKSHGFQKQVQRKFGKSPGPSHSTLICTNLFVRAQEACYTVYKGSLTYQGSAGPVAGRQQAWMDKTSSV